MKNALILLSMLMLFAFTQEAFAQRKKDKHDQIVTLKSYPKNPTPRIICKGCPPGETPPEKGGPCKEGGSIEITWQTYGNWQVVGCGIGYQETIQTDTIWEVNTIEPDVTTAQQSSFFNPIAIYGQSLTNGELWISYQLGRPVTYNYQKLVCQDGAWVLVQSSVATTFQYGPWRNIGPFKSSTMSAPFLIEQLEKVVIPLNS